MSFNSYRFVLLLFPAFFILSLPGCELKEKNPLFGYWQSEDKIMAVVNPDYKEVHLEFTPESMSINDKTIPVIYKQKDNQVVLFSRGEKVIAHIVDENKMVLFLRGIGKKQYVKVNH